MKLVRRPANIDAGATDRDLPAPLSALPPITGFPMSRLVQPEGNAEVCAAAACAPAIDAHANRKTKLRPAD